MKSTLRFAAICGAVLTLPTLSGCLDHPLKPAELDTEQVVKDQIQLNVNKNVDILFVLDNSGSMGEEQANLAANFGAFIGVLERPEVKANYRLGVTTTDNGNPWCPGTSPEAGALVYQSCTDRLTQFISQQGDVNVQDIACNNNCALSSAQLGIGAENGGKPWLENIDGTTNLPAGVSTTEAFQCLAPQGINGCGFESQLESMNKALIRFDTMTDEAFGFKRESALLAIVQVTDEVDCSYNNDHVAIFEADGGKVFWGDMTSNFPTSALCWNAGTSCTGDSTNYDCTSADFDANGVDITTGPNAEDDAVLHPLSRYISRVQGIENQKKTINPEQEVIVALIGGVGDNGEPSYADSQDAVFMGDFGIGPGCQAPVDGATACATDADCAGIGTQVCSGTGRCVEPQTAVPPVRLAEFTENFTEGNMFTVCSDNYAPALEAIASAIEDQLRPACYTECVQDQNATTPGILEPECSVVETVQGTSTILEECLKDANGYVIDPDRKSVV